MAIEQERLRIEFLELLKKGPRDDMAARTLTERILNQVIEGSLPNPFIGKQVEQLRVDISRWFGGGAPPDAESIAKMRNDIASKFIALQLAIARA